MSWPWDVLNSWIEGDEIVNAVHGLTQVKAARAAYEANRVYCQSIGDNSFLPWEQAPVSQRDTNLVGVRLILEKPDVTPAEMHASWLREKRDTGWAYGSVKDPVLKTHPCLVAYEELTPQQRLQDELFVAVVRAVLFG